jgi:regulator of protease activity HflC (stomatin/prohibitin superfamily)
VQNLGLDWDERVLPSIGSEVVKAIVAQYNAESLLTKRDEVSKAVCDALRKRAMDFQIVLDDVAITHLSFSQEFTKAVEAKQVAEQDAQRAQFVVQKAEQARRSRAATPAAVRFDGQLVWAAHVVNAPTLQHEAQLPPWPHPLSPHCIHSLYTRRIGIELA